MVLYSSDDPARQVRDRSKSVGWLLLAFTLITTVVLGVLPAPYVVDQPGPTYDTLGQVTTESGEVALITIGDALDYPQSGEMRLTTVTRLGNPEALPSWWEVLAAWVDREKSVRPVDSAFPPGFSVEENREAARIDMENSQQEAIAAALAFLDISFSSFVQVEAIVEGGPSEGIIEPGDVIAQAGGEPVADVTQLRALIADNGVQDPIDIAITRDGGSQTVQVIPRMSEGETPIPAIGVLVSGRYDFPFQVDILLENVGGPSAGLAFAIGVVEKLTAEEIVPPGVVASTGTISASGEVGGVGGVRHKAFGAEQSGARLFLIPAVNCDQVAGLSLGEMAIVPVETLSEAIDVLAQSRGGGELPSCSG